MATMKFKTNAKCSGCVARIGEELDKHIGHDQWQIDLSTPEHVLSVEADCSAADVEQWVRMAGYKAEQI